MIRYQLERTCSCGFCGPQVWEFEWCDDPDMPGVLGWALPRLAHGDYIPDPIDSLDDLLDCLGMCVATGEYKFTTLAPVT